MQIIEVSETWDREGSLEVNGAVREYTRTFRVRTDDTTIGPTDIIQACAFNGATLPLPNGLVLPSIGDTYRDANGDADLGCFAQGVRARQDQDDPFTWLVEYRYSSKPIDIQQQHLEEDPLSRPPIIHWSFQSEQKPMWQDLQGNAFVYSNKTPFDALPQIEEAQAVLTITRNEPTLDVGTMLTYNNSINKFDWNNWPALTGHMSIDATEKYENSLFFWEITYTIRFRKENWRLAVLDASTCYYDSNNKLRNFLDPAGQPLPPQMLDGTGKLLGQNAQPVYLEFQVYPEVDWAPLDLPASITP